jgi:hypothetical protein
LEVGKLRNILTRYCLSLMRLVLSLLLESSIQALDMRGLIIISQDKVACQGYKEGRCC